MTEPLKILICDDHRILTDALALIVESRGGYVLAAEPVTTGAEAVDRAVQTRPDVVLMDVDLEGDMDGIQATRLIKEKVSGAKVIVLTGGSKPGVMVDAVEAGASGFLDKADVMSNLLDVMDTVAGGGVAIDPAALAAMMQEQAKARKERDDATLLLNQLTAREREVLQLLASGRRNPDIAADLFISETTVQTHVRNALAKLGVRSKLEAVAFAARHGVISI
jgi:DNA-binding NarL/FixJ family response regulator